MPATAFGEFLGTLVLILLGNGVVAGVLLERSKAHGAGCWWRWPAGRPASSTRP
jgi:glycerol uptake facilitator-like aquaporin